MLFAMAIVSDRGTISEVRDNNSSDFSDDLVLSAQINDDNGFSDNNDEDQPKQGGVEPYQYVLAAESDSVVRLSWRLVVL